MNRDVDADGSNLPGQPSKDAEKKHDSESNEVIEAFEKIRDKPSGKLMFEAMSAMGPMGNPLHHKMDASHITQTLDLAKDHDEREYKLLDRKLDIAAIGSRYRFAVFIVVVAVLVFIIVMFRDKPDILIPILSGAGGVLAGFAAGWGYANLPSDS